jgi:flagellar biosynthesis/type III secretory pathway protein FliH
MDLQLLMGLPHLIHQGIEQGIEQGIHQGIEQGIEQGTEQSIEAIANVADTVFEWTSHNVRKSVPKVPCRAGSGG